MNTPQFSPRIAYKDRTGSLSPAELELVNSARPVQGDQAHSGLLALAALMQGAGSERPSREQETVWLKLWSYAQSQGRSLRSPLEAQGLSIAVARELALLCDVPPSFAESVEAVAEHAFTRQAAAALRQSPEFQHAVNGPTPEQFQGALRAFLSVAYDPVLCQNHWLAVSTIQRSITARDRAALCSALNDFGNSRFRLSDSHRDLSQLLEVMFATSVEGIVAAIPTTPAESWWREAEGTLQAIYRELTRFALGSAHPLAKTAT